MTSRTLFEYLLSFDPVHETRLADDQTLTPEEQRLAMAILRGMYGSIAEDWDDPSMDVYDRPDIGQKDDSNGLV